MTHRLGPGCPEPLGVTPTRAGVNVAVFSAHAAAVEVCLFDEAGEREVARIRLPERTGDVFHGEIEGVPMGARYGLRVHGPYEPTAGHRFNPFKLLVDPHAVALDRRFVLHPSMLGYRPGESHLSFDETDSAPFVPKAIVTAPDAPFAGARPGIGWADTILYELNVRGFTMRAPGVPEAMRGTFAGLSAPAALKRLTDLGVTSVELMPAAAWIDERHLGPLGLTNAWGYNPVALMAPEPKLAPGGWTEVRAAVDALHATGLEVILDVVLNHSGESDEYGPTVTFRGLDNASYYRLNPDDPALYINDMGCGNVLALDRPPLVRLAMDSLRTWARRAGVDGFRFDLATALGRRAEGFDPAAPLITAIGQDAELRSLKLIAEPWDIGPGGYQAGKFPAGWGEWNDRYRDGARRFWRGESHQLGALATRLSASADLFAAKRRPSRSINFITAHDGFTLADLVSYEAKHNEANGEMNRDGSDANLSWNHGVEGDTDNPEVRAARRRDQLNLIAMLLFSRGTPMLAMGAESGHSQQGNNNAYAQDNDLSWLDWDRADGDLLAATTALIAVRKRCGLLRRDHFLTGETEGLAEFPDAEWLRADGQAMQIADWEAADGATLVLSLAGETPDHLTERLLLVLHRGDTPCVITPPPARSSEGWRLEADTSLPPDAWRQHQAGEIGRLVVAPRSVALYSDSADPDRKRAPAPVARDLTIDRLTAAAGIQTQWWDHGGTSHIVSQQTRRALLTAMGLDVASEAKARDALASLADRRCRRGLPEAVHLRAGRAEAVTWASGDSYGRPPADLLLVHEDGVEQRLATPHDIVREEFLSLDSRRAWRTRITLPPLPQGRYRLIDEARPAHACHITVAPTRCYQPDRLPLGFGVSAQLYTLRSANDQGIGDLTTLAIAAEQAAAHGASALGINPLHALFPTDAERASPYHPSDRRFLDPIHIDIGALGFLPSSPEVERLMTEATAAIAALRDRPLVEYTAVSALKNALLRARFEAFRNAVNSGAADLWRAFVAFVDQGGTHLESFVAFRAISALRGGEHWRLWPDGLSVPTSAAVSAFAAQHQDRLAFEAFKQWLAERQLAEAAARAGAAGLTLGLYRDLAVGCAPDGAEAWAGGTAFASGASVGAPPDPFSANGQIWNLPPPNPLTMAAGGYAGFRTLIAANMRHAGMLRIDHVMGLQRLFWVPDGAKTSDGAYVAYPREALLAELALESHAARCMVVGEDLGTVPDGFREALNRHNVLSYRVLWFEREGAGFKAPEAYPADAVACVATHDLATLAGWWAGADLKEQAELGRIDDLAAASAARDAERAALVARLHASGHLKEAPDFAAPMTPELAAAIHAFVAATPALLAFAQADDLCAETMAVNLPGTDRERPNWRRRMHTPVESLFTGEMAATILAAIAAARSGEVATEQAQLAG